MEVAGQKKRGNYDDQPEVDEQCTKLFPSVSFGGFGYMFLRFCPIHGHTYVFHLIEGGEGQKDPFCSLFCCVVAMSFQMSKPTIKVY